MLNNFLQIVPEVIFDAAEKLGGRCTGRFYTLHALENRVYDIEMEEGPHLVIKFYRPGRWSRATIQAEHGFLKALDESEIPVVCPLTDNSGQSIFEITGVMFAIFPKRPGRLEPELSKEQLTRLGRFLARLHSVGATVKAAPRLRLDPQTYGREPLEFLKNGHFVPMELASRFEMIASQICAGIMPRFESAHYILLHGDCHSGNILWNRDDPYFIDFDDMLYAPPVQDIWMLTGGDDEYGKERRRILLEAYQQIRTFDITTLQLIEPLRALRMIHFSAWIARRWEDCAFKIAFPDFGTEHYWQEQIEALALQLEKVQYVTTDLYH
ncbi:MAG TPA: serine/threonine protein kinase [Candidatus Binatia bacterium]|nr:serine/threonine protein kinase [Candidatus Binatia bacterium]